MEDRTNRFSQPLNYIEHGQYIKKRKTADFSRLSWVMSRSHCPFGCSHLKSQCVWWFQAIPTSSPRMITSSRSSDQRMLQSGDWCPWLIIQRVSTKNCFQVDVILLYRAHSLMHLPICVRTTDVEICRRPWSAAGTSGCIRCSGPATSCSCTPRRGIASTWRDIQRFRVLQQVLNT